MHLVIPDPTPCPTCEGEGKLQGGPFWWYCPDCRCDVCGVPTETPPLCERHQRENDDRDAAKAYREGRYE